MPEQITAEVNGTPAALDAGPDVSLLTALREQLGLTGAKIGCAEGACGACTVLLDGRAARACVTPAAAAAGRAVQTIEGLAAGRSGDPGSLHPLQRAFLHEGAFQCGYCTPGMLMSAAALLAHQPSPDAAEVVAALDGNICRCGMYARIVRAVLRAAAELRGEEVAE